MVTQTPVELEVARIRVATSLFPWVSTSGLNPLPNSTSPPEFIFRRRARVRRLGNYGLWMLRWHCLLGMMWLWRSGIRCITSLRRATTLATLQHDREVCLRETLVVWTQGSSSSWAFKSSSRLVESQSRDVGMCFFTCYPVHVFEGDLSERRRDQVWPRGWAQSRCPPPCTSSHHGLRIGLPSLLWPMRFLRILNPDHPHECWKAAPVYRQKLHDWIGSYLSRKWTARQCDCSNSPGSMSQIGGLSQGSSTRTSSRSSSWTCSATLFRDYPKPRGKTAEAQSSKAPASTDKKKGEGKPKCKDKKSKPSAESGEVDCDETVQDDPDDQHAPEGGPEDPEEAEAYSELVDKSRRTDQQQPLKTYKWSPTPSRKQFRDKLPVSREAWRNAVLAMDHYPREHSHRQWCI